MDEFYALVVVVVEFLQYFFLEQLVYVLFANPFCYQVNACHVVTFVSIGDEFLFQYLHDFVGDAFDGLFVEVGDEVVAVLLDHRHGDGFDIAFQLFVVQLFHVK